MEKKKKLNYNIYLIGFMACGKTTAAAELKRLYRMETIDTDRMIERDAGCTVSEIFEKFGEEGFRETETEALKKLSARKNLVVSCGGGVPLREENVSLMKKGRVVLLSVPIEETIRRIRLNDRRPLASRKSDAEIRALYEARLPKYEAAADIVVNTAGKKREEVAREIMDRIV